MPPPEISRSWRIPGSSFSGGAKKPFFGQKGVWRTDLGTGSRHFLKTPRIA